MSETATMHIDGASRGNPGPAAFAIVLARPGHAVVEEAGTIGTTTNNVAEYTALVEGLQLAAKLGVKRLSVFSDSELMVKQMNGDYRVKSPELLQLFQTAKKLVGGFDTLKFTHVRREQNARADSLGNAALDAEKKKSQGTGDRGPGSASKGNDSGGRAATGSPPPSDLRVRDDALLVLRSAAEAWASRGISAVPVDAVWEQLWSVMEEGGVLKTPKKK